jgi:hypothetical protein
MQMSPYIKYAAYLAMAREQGLTDNEARLWLKYLASTGSLLYFPHIMELQGYVFLQPNWVRKAAYRIITHKASAGAGSLSRAELDALWATHAGEEQKLLLQILQAFQLLYSRKEAGGYVVPALAGRSLSLPDTGKLRPLQMFVACRFQPFMPAGMVARLTVALHTHVYENLYWQDRVILQHESAIADVTEDWRAKKLILVLKGTNKPPLLNMLLKTIQDIGFQTQRVKFSPHYLFQAYVLCRCEACRQDKDPYFYPYAYLQQLKGKKGMEVVCEASGQKVWLKTLFGEEDH